jgi:hypothetical protein
MAGFSVKIGANAVQLTKSLGELQKDLAALKKQLSTTLDASAVIKLNAAIAQTERQIKAISSAQNIKAIGRDMKELPAGFDRAGFAVGNFSRIVQDAPFSLLSGNLIAVSNNIDPLVQSFVLLKQQTGSAGAAFRALGNSLLGSGGLLLGFSLVNAAITFFSARSAFAKEKTKELSDTIRDAAAVEREAAASTAGQIAQINALAGTITNTNAAYEERKRALEELKSINKSYFGELQLEDAATGKLAGTIQEYTKALVNAAIVKEFTQEIAKAAKAASDAEADFDKANTKLINARKEFLRVRGSGAGAGREGTGLSNAEINAQQAEIEAFKEREAAGAKVTQMLTDQALLTDRLNKAVAAGLKLKDLDVEKTKKETDVLKQRIEALQKLQSETGLTKGQRIELAQLEIQLATRDAVKLGFRPEELQQRIQAIIEKSFPDQQVTSRLKIRVIGELDTSQVNTDLPNQQADINTALGLDNIDASKLNPVVKALQDAAAAKRELLRLDEAEKFSDFITDKLGPVFTDLFANIATEGESAFKSFIKAIGDLIKRLIAAAVAAAALSAILNAIFPGLGGKASFKAIFGQLTGLKFAEGGLVTRPTFGMFGEAGPEAVIPLSRLPQIIGQANNGNGAGGNFTARIVDGGRDLILIMQQANKTFGRNF